MKLDLAGSYRAQWGEGPIWWRDALYYVDIEGRRVLRYDPKTGEERSWEVAQRVGTVVPRQGGGLVIAGDQGFTFLDESSGELLPIADPEHGKEDNRFNDGKCAPDGRFFAGTISLAKKTGDAALYRLDQDLSVTEVYGEVTNSNGIVWTADGGKVFYIDTPRRAVLAFDYERARGLLENPRTAFSTIEASEASPDGMTIDRDGNLWIAFCHGSCVVCFDPAGRELRRVELPCREVTAVAFGGETLGDLYITTGIPGDEVEPEAGRLFVARGLGVHGVPANAFAG
jgi:sugar lactone lactonase YvrE